MHSNLSAIALFTTTAALITTSAHGAIVSVSGSAALIAAPISAQFSQLPGPPAYCWNEQSNVSWSAGVLSVNTLGNGFWTGPTPNAAFLAAGPAVDSHMIHFDATQGVSNVGGQVVFSSNIVAVIYENVLLDATDAFLGAVGTTYETGNPIRSHNASLFQSAFQVNNNVLDFTLWASTFALPNRMTELRVLTAAGPAPGAIALLGLAGLVGTRRRG
jgi:MYXO-CTERM domain-containing protein